MKCFSMKISFLLMFPPAMFVQTLIVINLRFGLSNQSHLGFSVCKSITLWFLYLHELLEAKLLFLLYCLIILLWGVCRKIRNLKIWKFENLKNPREMFIFEKKDICSRIMQEFDTASSFGFWMCKSITHWFLCANLTCLSIWKPNYCFHFFLCSFWQTMFVKKPLSIFFTFFCFTQMMFFDNQKWLCNVLIVSHNNKFLRMFPNVSLSS